MLADPKAELVVPSQTEHTLSICRRIRQRAEFEQVFLAKRWTNKWFTIYVQKNESGFARLGIVASKKALPKAVSRNFAKRLIREMFRCEFPSERELDVVVRAKRQISSDSLIEGRRALAQLLKAIQV